MPINPIFSHISIFVTSHSSSLLGWAFAITSDLDYFDQQLFSVNCLFRKSNITLTFQFQGDRNFRSCDIFNAYLVNSLQFSEV